jgi:hypothetical protein
MAEPTLTNEPAPVVRARFQQFAMVYTLAITVCAVELISCLASSGRMGIDQLFVQLLLGLSHLVKRRPNRSAVHSHLRTRKGLSPVREVAESKEASHEDMHRPAASTNT